ncbi:MAG: hypothetical protein K9G62_08600 [Alphaproteobacteria bacterium]|nr:hypothetical protein [Alphaproteobacteria bacterium]
MENGHLLSKPKKPCIVVKFNGVATVFESDLTAQEINNHFDEGGTFHFRGQAVSKDHIIFAQ